MDPFRLAEALPALLERSAAAMVPAVVFRALPFAGYVLLAGRSLGTRAVAALCLAAGLTCALREGASLLRVSAMALAVYAYFAGIGALLFVFARHVERERRKVWLWLPALSVLCLLVPLQSPIPDVAIGMATLIGWELLLGGFSYLTDVSSASRPTLGRCLFFLLLSPALVVSEATETKGSAPSSWKSFARCGLGLLAWLGQDAAYAVSRAISADQVTYGAVALPLSAFAVGALQFVGYYWGHSGLASVRIGLLGIAGHRVGEGYRMPLLATSPHDFWRRWNVWLGSWARRYVFGPTHLRLRRSLGPRWRTPSVVLAVLLTFLVVGALHDLPSVVRGEVSTVGPYLPRGMALFGLNGLLLIVWIGVGRFAGALVRCVRPLGRVLGPLVVLPAISLLHRMLEQFVNP
jgi:MBOAT, membrane-bound O-acyltransferase family